MVPARPPAEQSETELESVVIEVREIDRKKWKIEGIDDKKDTWSFVFESKTKIHTLSPEEETVSLSILLAQDPDGFPIEEGQQILVHWKLDTERQVRIAKKFTLLKTE